jgi:hypothetical protein
MFKIGYYYKFIGNLENYRYWYEDMKKLLDNKWHKCVEIQKKPFYYNHTSYYAKFEGMEDGWSWFYVDFIESKHHPYVKRLLKELLCLK